MADCLKAAGISVPGEIRRYPLANGEMRNDKPHWEIVRAELGEEDGASLVSVSVHRNGSNKRRSMEQRVGMLFAIDFEAPVSLPMPALGHTCHFGLGLFVPARPSANG